MELCTGRAKRRRAIGIIVDIAVDRPELGVKSDKSGEVGFISTNLFQYCWLGLLDNNSSGLDAYTIVEGSRDSFIQSGRLDLAAKSYWLRGYPMRLRISTIRVMHLQPLFALSLLKFVDKPTQFRILIPAALVPLLQLSSGAFASSITSVKIHV
jgi:hypothetical protein